VPVVMPQESLSEWAVEHRSEEERKARNETAAPANADEKR